MATTRDTVDHATLERLVEAGVVRGANIVGQAGGWSVVIQYGMSERALAAKRGAVRIFRKFETLASYLRGIGIVRYQVDATQFDPVALKTGHKREDAAERMKHAHAAAAYDKEFRAGVQASLDDPRPSLPHAQVASKWATKRAELVKKAGHAG